MQWRKIQKQNFKKIEDLCAFLALDSNKLSLHSRFVLNLPVRLAEKIEKGRLNDPILRQFVPLLKEERSRLGFVDDPVEDASFCKTEKLLQKYEGRALLLTTSACAMHCRYCFRQNFDYSKKSLFEEECILIAKDPSIHEVILSGGDPLSLSDQDLKQLIEKLEAIPHLKIIRFHSRFLIGIPERATEEFLQLLSSRKKQIVFVLHANHPKELDKDVMQALKNIQKLGIPTLLQSVLLKGVNDNEETLKELFLLSAAHGLLPYYLHRLDKVKNAAHFEVEKEIGKQLIQKLRNQLPGYAVPQFVEEVPGEASKTIV